MRRVQGSIRGYQERKRLDPLLEDKRKEFRQKVCLDTESDPVPELISTTNRNMIYVKCN